MKCKGVGGDGTHQLQVHPAVRDEGEEGEGKEERKERVNEGRREERRRKE